MKVLERIVGQGANAVKGRGGANACVSEFDSDGDIHDAEDATNM